jgi:hypothetical protein
VVTVIMRNGQRAEVQTGASIEAGIFPTETGATPSPALLVQDAAGETVATFRTAEVAWFASDDAVRIA